MAITSCVYCQTYNMTFQVDMTNFTGFTTPEVNGTFSNSCGACATLSDANGDNTWEGRRQRNDDAESKNHNR